MILTTYVREGVPDRSFLTPLTGVILVKTVYRAAFRADYFQMANFYVCIIGYFFLVFLYFFVYIIGYPWVKFWLFRPLLYCRFEAIFSNFWVKYGLFGPYFSLFLSYISTFLLHNKVYFRRYLSIFAAYLDHKFSTWPIF